MDLEHKESILSELSTDLKFSRLKPQEMLRYLVDYYLVASNGLELMIANTECRLSQWKEDHSDKSSKRSKKYYEMAQEVLEQLDRSSGDVGDQTEHLQLAEQMYKKAIELLHVEAVQDKVCLHQERAKIRYRAGKYKEAIQDIGMAMHFASGHQAEESLDMKMLVIECMAAIEPIDSYCTNKVIGRLINGDPQAESLVATILSQADINQSNYGANAFQMARANKDDYFRYLLDGRLKIKGNSVGRQLVATEDIESGSIVLVEKPLTSVVAPEYLASKCNYCLKELSQENPGLLCDSCHEVRFCSLQCLKDGYLAYHRHECGFLGLLLSQCGLAGTHVYRTVSQVGLRRALNYKPLVYTVEHFLQDRSLRTKAVTELTNEDRMELYRMASSLVNHESRHSTAINAQHAIQAIDLSLLLLATQQDFLERLEGNNIRDCFLKLVQLCFGHLRRVMFNVYEMRHFSQSGDHLASKCSSVEASCQILLGSLFNHSSVANVKWHFQDGHVVFKASKHITPNEVLTIDYAQ